MTLNIIFDLNGTMIDDEDAQIKAWVAYAARHGKEISEDYYRKELLGMTCKETFEKLFGTVDEDKVHAMSLEKEKIYMEIYTPYLRAGLREFLDELKTEEIPLAIATSAMPELVAFIMDKIGVIDRFTLIMDDTAVTQGKPDPEIYLETANRLGAKPEHCVVFEDAKNGVLSAKAAGMKVIGVGDVEGCDLNIQDFTGLTVAKVRELLDTGRSEE
jgi:beta-phosphoglucomutase